MNATPPGARQDGCVMTTERIDHRVLGRYRALRPLAVGGMGVIYLARSEGAAGFAKPVVVKRIDPRYMRQDDEAEAYFVNEAKILAQMRHPGIVGIVDFGREPDGTYAMVLEYVHGFTLNDWLAFHRQKNERFPVDEAIYLVRRILGALEYAHTSRTADGTQRGVVHRDVTPSNVLIDVDGHIKLADFGIARTRSNAEGPRATKVRGKLSYLAPELLSGRDASIASDVYSAALVLHELLLGINEFRTADPGRTFARIVGHVPTRVSAKREDVPPSLDDILAQALAKTPAQRYPSADALAEALRLVQRASDAEIERNLKARVRADFEGELPALLGLERLGVRAAALNESRESVPPPPPARLRAAPGGKSRHVFAAAAMLAALLTIGSGALARFTARERPVETRPSSTALDHGEPTATLPARSPEALPALAVSSLALAPAPPPAAPARTDRARLPARPTHSSEDYDLLARTFAWHRPAVQGCYEKHPADLSASPHIAVRFHVGRSGDVEGVGILPARLGRTALGLCILGVARNARFGPQDDEWSFTIPVTAYSASRP